MTRILPPSPENIALAAEAILNGELVGMPTETVYGLAADASSDTAVRKIYQLKGRPSFNPLIAHCFDLEMALTQIHLVGGALDLAQAFWPGPLTLVGDLAQTCTVSATARAGLDSLAVRIPAHTAARDLLEVVQRPLVAPSANPSGRISPTLASHVASDFATDLDVILDGGAAECGLESTIIDVRKSQFFCLRAGPLSRVQLENICGPIALPPQTAKDPDAPRAPGQLLRHYAPRAQLRLNANRAEPGEALLGFGNCPGATLNLSYKGDMAEASYNLFAMLRTLDETFDKIAISPIPQSHLSEALHDRLARAAERP